MNGSTFPRFFRRALPLVLGIAVVMASLRSAHATPALRKELAGIAAGAAQVIKDRGQDAIAIGPFTGPSTLETAGPGIQQILKEELEKQKLTVRLRADVVINGTYSAEATAKGLTLQIKATLVDALGKPLVQINSNKVQDFPIRRGTIETKVRDERTAVAFMQPTMALPPDESLPNRANRVRDHLQGKGAAPVVEGTRVFVPGKQGFGRYGLEILVNGRPRKLTVKDGTVFVGLKRGEVYEVRLINQTSHDASIELSIDGINTFAFTTIRRTSGPHKGEPAYSTWIVPPRSTSRIPGWHKKNAEPNNFDSFLITSYAKSAAAVLQHRGSNLGTITAVFSAAWKPGADPPPGEPPATRNPFGNATGFGPPKSVKDVKPVERRVGVVRGVISIRYSRPRP